MIECEFAALVSQAGAMRRLSTGNRRVHSSIVRAIWVQQVSHSQDQILPASQPSHITLGTRKKLYNPTFSIGLGVSVLSVVSLSLSPSSRTIHSDSQMVCSPHAYLSPPLSKARLKNQASNILMHPHSAARITTKMLRRESSRRLRR